KGSDEQVIAIPADDCCPWSAVECVNGDYVVAITPVHEDVAAARTGERYGQHVVARSSIHGVIQGARKRVVAFAAIHVGEAPDDRIVPGTAEDGIMIRAWCLINVVAFAKVEQGAVHCGAAP